MVRFSLALMLLCVGTGVAYAQPAEPTFGMEFEFAGQGNRIVRFEEMPFENYKKIMEVIVRHYGGDPSTIRPVDFEKPTSNLEKFPTGMRPLFKAEWKDPRGRTWLIEPEFVASTGLDGYELVTPPMDDTKELRQILEKVQGSGLVRTARRSGVHLTLDANSLIKSNGDARALANLIVMHENMEPTLRRIFNPVRGGGHKNYFARSLATDHPELLEEIDRLRPNERTRERLAEIFKSYEGREATIHEADPMDPNSWNKVWKYRSMNLAKALPINENHTSSRPLVEFRTFDLANAEAHELQARLYRRMLVRAQELAAEGKTVKLQPRATMPAGEDMVAYNTPADPAEAKNEARQLIESLGLDPAEFETLLERNVQPRTLRTEAEFRGMLEGLPDGRIMHNGKPMTFGFELEGRGNGLVNIARPTDAETNARWDTMSEAQRRAYYDSVVGSNHSSVKEHFKLDTQRHSWLSDYWYVEGSGNWEIHSNVLENLKESTDAMRRAKELTGKSGKGFHLHMRDNAPDWEKLEARSSQYADFVERASNWVYLERVNKLRTDLSLKSWSNARLSPSEISNIAELSESDRATIRVAEVDRPYSSGETGYIDMEIRGFTKDVDNIERLAKIFAHQFKNHEWGAWGHEANKMETAGSSWYSSGNSVPESISYEKHFERYLAEVTGQAPTPEKMEIIRGLQSSEWSNKAGGSARAYSTGVSTPLLPWHLEGSLDEATRRTMKFSAEEYLGWLDRYADKIQSGEFGLDLKYANEQALIEKLGMSPAEAKAAVAARRAGGTIKPADITRASALRTAAAPEKLAFLDAIDLNTADKEELKRRLGLSEAEANKLLRYRTPHDVESSFKKANVNEAREAEVRAAAQPFDIGASEVTAESLVERLGIDIEEARNIVRYRDAHDIRNETTLREGGFSDAEVERVMALANSNADINDLRTLSVEELQERYGVTKKQAKALERAREANSFSRWKEVVDKADLSETAKEKLKSGLSNLSELNTLSVEELIERAGITEKQARKLVNYRDAVDVTSESKLREVLGENAGRRLHVRAKGVNVASATAQDLTRAGLESELSRRLIDFRRANLIGRSAPGSPYNAELASEMLYDADVVEYETTDKIEARTGGVDLTTASKSQLVELGLTEAQAEKLITHRDAHKMTKSALESAGFSEAKAKEILEFGKKLDPKTASVEEIMERTGLTQAKAKKVKALAEINWGSATVEQMREAGLTKAQAEELVELRTKAGNAEGLNYSEIVRKLRLRVRKWVRESGLSEQMLRSLLPKTNVAETTLTNGQGEGFGRVRRGTGPFEPSKMSMETVGGVFESVREAALLRVLARRQKAEDAAAARNLDLHRSTIEGLELEVLQSNDILAERDGKAIRVSTGLLNEIHARAEKLPVAERPFFRARVLGLIMAHESAHASGLKSEKLADAEGVRILDAADGLGRVVGIDMPLNEKEIREAVMAFDKPTGSSKIDNLFNRLRGYFQYGATSKRLENLERAAAGQNVDKLAQWRRSDGTVDWKRFSRDTASREALGLAHFGLALFLKELAVVTATGDRARIEEFFDGLMTTDFYKHYGLFVAGARVGEVAYVRYLQRYVKPRFVNGLLKTNLVLAAGLALPMIVEGNFEGRAFAISLGSLGISSAAVKGGVSSIRWVMSLSRARKTGVLARLGLQGSRLARFGGWFYTAAELAVVLYFAEEIDQRVNAWLDQRAARAELAAANERYLAKINDPDASAEVLAAAGDEVHQAWIAYRDFLYGPLHVDEITLASRLEKVARAAKLQADERAATLDRLRRHPNLARSITNRYGSLEAYADARQREDEAKIQEQVETYLSSYERSRAANLEAVYRSNRREGDFLDDLGHPEWLLAGGVEGSASDPWGQRSDPFASWGRDSARKALTSALGGASKNRLQAYEDERALYERLLSVARAAGRERAVSALERQRDRVDVLSAADRRLIESGGAVEVEGAVRRGAADRVRGR
ncbi:MAG TPA: hypothetical protein DEA08_35750 [Planctomycetes bacterium]|nr:hypothetical protein [Planctomycetota bacterium]